MDDKLLTPELSPADAGKPIYSVRAGFLVAFFGGPVATTLFSALNSWNAGRLKRDLAIYLAGMVLAIGIFVYALLNPETFRFTANDVGLGSFRHVNRFLGLLLFGAYYLLLQRNYRASALFDDAPSPWAPAIACILLATLVGIAVVTILGMFGGLAFLDALRAAAGI